MEVQGGVKVKSEECYLQVSDGWEEAWAVAEMAGTDRELFAALSVA